MTDAASGLQRDQSAHLAALSITAVCEMDTAWFFRDRTDAFPCAASKAGEATAGWPYRLAEFSPPWGAESFDDTPHNKTDICDRDIQSACCS
jgi:hypothetical protein